MAIKFDSTIKVLCEMLQKLDSSESEDRIHHFFKRNDYINTGTFSKSAVVKANQAPKPSLHTWIISAIELLGQVNKDVELALRVTHWNPDISRQFIDLTRFLADYFGVWKLFERKLQKELLEESQAIEVTQGIEAIEVTKKNRQLEFTSKIKTSRQLENLVEAGPLTLTRMYEVLIDRRASLAFNLAELQTRCPPNADESNSEATSKIPCATLRELLLQNEVTNRRDEIQTAIDSNDSESQKVNLRRCILSIYAHFRDLQQRVNNPKISPQERLTNLSEQFIFDLHDFSDSDDEVDKGLDDDTPTKSISKATDKQDLRLTWSSGCLAIVVDTANRITITGGTRPSCHDFSLVDPMAAAMKAQRLGERFTKIINTCSEKFTQNAEKRNKAEAPTTPAEYRALVRELGQFEAQEQLPASRGNDKIYSFACKGNNFEGLAPCIRCQTFYPSWIMHRMPNEKQMVDGTLSFANHLTMKGNGPDKEWTYCAESVAAAKLFLLRNGSIQLV